MRSDIYYLLHSLSLSSVVVVDVVFGFVVAVVVVMVVVVVGTFAEFIVYSPTK